MSSFGNHLELTYPGRKKTTVLVVDSKENVTSFSSKERLGFYTKERIIAVFLGTGNSNKIQMLLKHLYRDVADEYFNNWLILREAKIPTLGSMRVVDAKTVAMGDLTRNGGDLFGKAKLLDWLRYPLKQMTSISEKVFSEMDLSIVFKEAERIAELATSNWIHLPKDDPMDVLVEPDGKWQVIVLDLTQLSTIDSNERTDLQAQVLKARNDRLCRQYCSRLTELQELIRPSLRRRLQE